jgi:hypothetical protein
MDQTEILKMAEKLFFFDVAIRWKLFPQIVPG